MWVQETTYYTGSRSNESILAARGDKSAMRPFAKLLSTLVVAVVIVVVVKLVGLSNQHVNIIFSRSSMCVVFRGLKAVETARQRRRY